MKDHQMRISTILYQPISSELDSLSHCFSYKGPNASSKLEAHRNFLAPTEAHGVKMSVRLASKQVSRQASKQAGKQAGNQSINQASKQASRQKLRGHSVGAMPCGVELVVQKKV